MRSLLLLGLLTAAASAELTFSQLVTVNKVVPDNQTGGILSSTIITSDIASITSVQLTLNMSGGWNGDLYAYLAHESGFAVLLNRIGSTSSDPFGSGSSGFAVTFGDDWDDIHTASFPDGAPVTGFFSPDGRTASPFAVTDASERTAFLSSFVGLGASGLWELFIADLSGGDLSTFQSWQLDLAGTSFASTSDPSDPPDLSAIPEPSAILPFAALFAAALCRRQRRSAR